MKVDRLWTQARLATLVPGGAPYGAIEDAILAALEARGLDVILAS